MSTGPELDVTVSSDPIADADAPRPDPAATEVAEQLGIDLAETLGALEVDGSSGSVARIPTGGQLRSTTLAVVGTGQGEPDGFRRAGAAVAGVASRLTSMAVAIPAADDPEAAAQAFVEGLVLGAYRFDRFKSDPDGHTLETVTLHTEGANAEEAARRGRTIGAAVCLVRDLVNLPPGDKRPPALAERTRELIEGLPIEISVLDEAALQEGGYGGLLGVGAGSSEESRLVELSYEPEGATRHVALVGKGITFDTGGLSLKPPEAMETMKMDMGGAAAVLGTVVAAAELGLPVRLTGLMAMAENMPSGTATRPSDVLNIRGGKTVEVMNTDAEGRLVLADALVHAQEREPDTIIDIATLTGAALVALGEKIGVLMSTDDQLADELLEAGTRSADPFWRLPVAAEEYRSKLDSEVADIKNTGGRNAGTITAGLFLKEFVEDGVSWAHLDIAGVAWGYDSGGYVSKGLATGSPVRMLVEWLSTSVAGTR